MDNTKQQYIRLIQGFEQELSRELTDEEREFLKWMANKLNQASKSYI